jgi:hypothetical protein
MKFCNDCDNILDIKNNMFIECCDNYYCIKCYEYMYNSTNELVCSTCQKIINNYSDAIIYFCMKCRYVYFIDKSNTIIICTNCLK